MLNTNLSANIELLPMDTSRALYVGDTITLSRSMSDFKYITFCWGSPNNQIAHDVPVSAFKLISNTLPAHYIIWQWNNFWYRLQYIDDTHILCFWCSRYFTTVVAWGYLRAQLKRLQWLYLFKSTC